MMSSNLLTFIGFVLIMTFTPGPSNISSASMGILYGYRKALMFLAGLATGVLLVMVVSGLVSTALLSVFPSVEPVLRIIGAGYILYLAWVILKASYTFEQTDTKPMGYVQGVLLQILNPKLMVYALTLFSTFLAPIVHHLIWLLVAAVLLSATSYLATSTWALFGTGIKRYLHQPRAMLAVNVLLSLFLVYTAVDIVGIL